jgi:hypothetical protein
LQKQKTVKQNTKLNIIYTKITFDEIIPDANPDARLKIAKSIIEYYTNCVNRLTAIKDICECRSTEGKYINQEIAAMRTSIFDLIRHRKNVIKHVPVYLPNCADQLIPVLPLPEKKTSEQQKSDLLTKHMLTELESNPNDSSKPNTNKINDLAIVVFNVFNNSPDVTEKTLYVNLNDLKDVYQRWYIYITYFDKLKTQNNASSKSDFVLNYKHPLHATLQKYTNHEQIMTDFTIAYNKLKTQLNDYATSVHEYHPALANEILDYKTNKGKKPFRADEWMTIATKDGMDDLKSFIDFVQTKNNTSPLGTLEFMDHMARMDTEDSVTGTCTSTEPKGEMYRDSTIEIGVGANNTRKTQQNVKK